ncbi:hypothetical protein [Azospirillum sp. TSO22-1]|uniref:hypothetical protein n=1 Tax=Azospirillum sp. TSO22-1 TaxID=716789 RepID=UPI000D61AA03|nr:hypothetical protein [Azospirillum sp. TSO22-1]PWC54783.1 hypothetical protein TSO221_07060 [Azospirillum sp. TSO22-1]
MHTKDEAPRCDGAGERNGIGVVLAVCAFALFGFALVERTDAFPRFSQPAGCATAASLKAPDGLAQARAQGAFIRVLPSAVQRGGVDPKRGGQMLLTVSVEVVKAGCPTVRADGRFDAAFEMVDGVPKITRVVERVAGVPLGTAAVVANK